MKQYKINLLPGDGIGVDVIHEGKRVMESLEAKSGGIHFDFKTLLWSCKYYLEHGKMMPKDGLKMLANCDAILLGAVGFPGVPDHISLHDLLLPIRTEFDEYVNLRPVRLLDGLHTPLKNDKIDFIAVPQ